MMFTYNQAGSYDVDELAARIFDLINSKKRIHKPNVDVEDMKYLVSLANAINACDEFTYELDDVNFNDMKYPKALEFLIHPSKVAFDGTNYSTDLLLHDDSGIPEGFKYDPNYVVQITEAMYGTLKRSGTYINVACKRKADVLNNVNHCVSVDSDGWRFHSKSDEHVWPIPVFDFVAGLYRPVYYNEDADYSMNQYILLQMSFDDRPENSNVKDGKK